jgi:small subunit ribosomal protein S17
MKRILTGIVVSTSMDKTVVVEINRKKQHPKYHKYYTVTKKYLAHDENNSAKQGDSVQIIESKPISKRKRWMLMEKST